AESASRGIGYSGRNWGAFLRGRAVSPQRRTHAAAVWRPESAIRNPPSAIVGGGRSVRLEGHRGCPPPERQVVGVAGGNELGAAVAPAGQEERSSPDVSRDLRLVH